VRLQRWEGATFSEAERVRTASGVEAVEDAVLPFLLESGPPTGHPAGRPPIVGWCCFDARAEVVRSSDVGLAGLTDEAAERLRHAVRGLDRRAAPPGTVEEHSLGRVPSGDLSAWLAPTDCMTRVAAVAWLGLERTTAADGALEGLTARQREEATLLLSSRSYGEIGAALGISENTVGRHASAIYRRLGVSGRLELLVGRGRRS